MWSWFSGPASTPHSEPSSPERGAAGGSDVTERSTVERLKSDSTAVRLSEAAEQHVPRLLDGRGNVTQSLILSHFALRQLAGAVPARFAYADWRLLYSTAVHGISLNTFYSLTAGCGCCCLAIQDGERNIFGGFCTEWREPSVPPKFYGGGETFVYSIEKVDSLPPLPGVCPRGSDRVRRSAPPDAHTHVGPCRPSCLFVRSGRRTTTQRGSARQPLVRCQLLLLLLVARPPCHGLWRPLCQCAPPRPSALACCHACPWWSSLPSSPRPKSLQPHATHVDAHPSRWLPRSPEELHSPRGAPMVHVASLPRADP